MRKKSHAFSDAIGQKPTLIIYTHPEFPGEKPGWIQAVTLSLRAGQQVTGTVLNSNGLRTEQRLAPTVSMV